MADSAMAGMRLGTRLAPHCPRLVLVLSDGLAVNGTDLVRGLAESLPHDTMIVGGLAADGDRFARTWVLVDGAPASGHVTAIGLSGPLVLGAGSQGGWDVFGPERRVTRAQGNVLYELDGKPALVLYKSTWASWPRDSSSGAAVPARDPRGFGCRHPDRPHDPPSTRRRNR
jgi:hypothetical protein